MNKHRKVKSKCQSDRKSKGDNSFYFDIFNSGEKILVPLSPEEREKESRVFWRIRREKRIKMSDRYFELGKAFLVSGALGILVMCSTGQINFWESKVLWSLGILLLTSFYLIYKSSKML